MPVRVTVAAVASANVWEGVAWGPALKAPLPLQRQQQTPAGPSGVYRAEDSLEGAASSRPRGSRRPRTTRPTASSPREALATETLFPAAGAQARSRVAGTRLPAEILSAGAKACKRARPHPCTLRSRPGQSEHGLFPSAEKRPPISGRRRRPGNSVLEWAGPARPGGSLRALVAPRGGEPTRARVRRRPRPRSPRASRGAAGAEQGAGGQTRRPRSPRGRLPPAGMRSPRPDSHVGAARPQCGARGRLPGPRR